MSISDANIGKLELSSLRALSALLAERSVTRAADRLGVSQPTMSQYLRRLREVFGDPILVRVQGGLAPTPRAEALAAPVADILNRARNLLDSGPGAIAPRKLHTRISIVASDYVQHLVLTEIVRRLGAEAPHIQLDMRLTNRARAREWMELGEVDLGIGPVTVPSGRMHFSSLYRDEAACILGKQHFGDRDKLTLERFCAIPHVRVLPAQDGFFDQAIDRALERVDRTRRIALSMQGFMLVPRVVRESPLIATLPLRLLKRMYVTRELWVRDPPVEVPEMTVGMYWHERTHRSPVHRWFRALVQETLGTIT